MQLRSVNIIRPLDQQREEFEAIVGPFFITLPEGWRNVEVTGHDGVPPSVKRDTKLGALSQMDFRVRGVEPVAMSEEFLASEAASKTIGELEDFNDSTRGLAALLAGGCDEEQRDYVRFTVAKALRKIHQEACRRVFHSSLPRDIAPPRRNYRFSSRSRRRRSRPRRRKDGPNRRPQ